MVADISARFKTAVSLQINVKVVKAHLRLEAELKKKKYKK